MTETNKDKKRYVYFDKYLEYQVTMDDRIKRINKIINVIGISQIIIGLIAITMFVLQKLV